MNPSNLHNPLGSLYLVAIITILLMLLCQRKQQSSVLPCVLLNKQITLIVILMENTNTKSLRSFILWKREEKGSIKSFWFCFSVEKEYFTRSLKTSHNRLFTCVIQSFQHEANKQSYTNHYLDRRLKQTNSLFMVVASLALVITIQSIFFPLQNQDNYKISQVCLSQQSVS